MVWQVGRCHPSFQHDFVANFSTGVWASWVSWKIGKIEKWKALNHHKEESNKKGWVVKFTER